MRRFRDLARKLPTPIKNQMHTGIRIARSVQTVVQPPAIGSYSYRERVGLAARMEHISWRVHCPHRQSQVAFFIDAFSGLSPAVEGVIVECGCFKGGSTAKFSIAAERVGRDVVACDSFEGLPDNDEKHEQSIFGHSIRGWFAGGEFAGSLEEVQDNVGRFGRPDRVTYLKGWFDDTLPSFDQQICALYIDVDLASSTRTCLKYLYPRVSPGGVVVSQDGDFPRVIEVFDDDAFWEREVGCQKPHTQGLGTDKMIKIVKPS